MALDPAVQGPGYTLEVAETQGPRPDVCAVRSQGPRILSFSIMSVSYCRSRMLPPRVSFLGGSQGLDGVPAAWIDWTIVVNNPELALLCATPQP